MQRIREYIEAHVTGAHLARFGFSLLVAILLWGWVTQLQDPVQTSTYAELNITQPELEGAVQIVTTLPRASVTLTDVESKLESISRSDIAVELDTSTIDGSGTFEVPLVASTSTDIRDIEVSPDSISVQVEEEVSENFPLTVENQVLADNAHRIVDISPEVSEVTVTGTESAVNRIEQIVLPVSIDSQSSDFTDMITPYAVDEDKQRVQEVTILPQQVRTDVEIETRGKTVSVVPQLTGSPTDGYVVQQQVSIPATIIVDGPDDALQSLLFINTQPVDISNADESISEIVSLEELPDGVTLVEPADDQVEVRVSIGSSVGTANIVPDMPIEIMNLGSALTAEIEPDVADVSVSASGSTLSALTPDDIVVSVDASGLGPGVYTLAVEVEVPDNVDVSLVDPDQATIIISEGIATPAAWAPAVPLVMGKPD